MIKTIIPILFLLFISCKKEQPEIKESTTKLEKINLPESQIKIDTVQISSGDEIAKNDFILANLLKKTTNKDSITTAFFRIDFYRNNQKKYSTEIVSRNFEEGSEWYASYVLNNQDKNNSFLQLSYGYPACGYIQENFLYYFSDNSLELLHKSDTSSDSGWGVWQEFLSPEPNSNTVFYSRTTSFSPEEDNEDMGIIEFSDSIKFERIGNKWKKEFITPKDFVYRKKRQLFDEFHKIEN